MGNHLSETYNGRFNGWALEETQHKQLIEVSQDEFKAMRDAIDESINRDTAGLDDIMLKRILLAYNTGKYSRNADIIIELTDEEGKACENDNKLSNPFVVVQGKDLEQLNVNAIEDIKNSITKWFDGWFSEEDVQTEIDIKKEKQNKYYLHANGVLKFVAEVKQFDGKTVKEEELVYYSEDVLENLYKNEFEENRYGASSGYAESVWEYLSSKCYTDGDKGMKMYSYQKVEEELIEWTFEDDDCEFWEIGADTVAINKQMISDGYLIKDEWRGTFRYFH